ncbi:MAG: tRNA ((34)/cytosine(34)/5-carboxymethylaminomethyluridine(34)-2-O)-methyltransferase TrmL [Pseudomonadota bacterium]|jgi:tRNA (cytidine/uridine-2'-O-)-methyltransferase
MVEVVLYQPEIAPNTGNIIRLCANTGARLHLIKPLGFSLNEKALRRAGMDYTEIADVKVHENWSALDEALALSIRRIFGLTTRGTTRYDTPKFLPQDVFIFGPETRGLPEEVLSHIPPECQLRLPMQPSCRSMNLSNAVAVMVFEAWRQMGFCGGA